MKKTIVIIILISFISINTIATSTGNSINTKSNVSILSDKSEIFFLAKINTNGTGICSANEVLTGTQISILIDISYENDPTAETTITSIIGNKEKTIAGNHRLILIFFTGEKELTILSENNCKINGNSFFILLES